MPNFAILRTAKLPSIRAVTGSAQHTFRELQTPNADPIRTKTNRVLVGPDSAKGIAEAVRARCDLVTEHQARAIPCIEYLVTASPGSTAMQSQDYFDDALKWLQQRHGAANIVSAVIHLDETSPHLVVYAVPLVETPGKTRKRSVNAGRGPDGKMQRKTIEVREPGCVRLSAATFLDGRAKLSKMQDDFALLVGKPHGLRRGIRGSTATHTTIKEFYGLLDAEVTDELGPQLAEFGRAMHRVARQRLVVAEQATADAEQAKAQALQLESELETAKRQSAKLSGWFTARLHEIWDALHQPNAIETARQLLIRAMQALGINIPAPPQYRADVIDADLGGGTFGARWSIYARDDQGEYEVESDLVSSRNEAEAICRTKLQQIAPRMNG